MLGLRGVEGIPAGDLPDHGISSHLLDVSGGRAVLTLEGRLVADAVIRTLALAGERTAVLG
jgi:hypothetical protein